MNKAAGILAHRYAQAYVRVFGQTIDRAQLEGFEKAALFFKKHKSTCFLMNLSLVNLSIKTALLDDLCDKLMLDLGAKKLCLLLVASQRSFLISPVLYAIIEIYKKRTGMQTFAIQSSCELSVDQKQKLEFFLNKQIVGSVICSYAINAELIAGIRISSGMLLWENSIQGRLRMLKDELKRR